jgi:osmotically-inducible protein OsmY
MTTLGPGREPADYVISHIQDALAHDSRTTELGIDVTLSGDRAVLTGTVASPEQRTAIGQVATEVARDYQVVNEVAVVPCDEAGEAEELT